MSASKKSADELARQLWAIGDIARLNLLQLLPEAADDCTQGNNVSTLAEKLGMSQPTVSHHLRVLRQAGIVQNQKMCRDVYYWIDPVEAAAVLDDLRQVLLTQEVVAAHNVPEVSPKAEATPKPRKVKASAKKKVVK